MRAVWRVAVAVVRYELALWRNLWRWARRRPPLLPAGAHGFGYAAGVAPTLRAFVIISAVELPIVHFVVPWSGARLALDVLGVYGLVWMVGLLATTRQEPHLVGPAGIRVRYGMTGRLAIPAADIASITARTRTLPPGTVLVEDEPDGGRAAHLAVVGQTNVDVVLRGPRVLPLRRAAGRPLTAVRFYADDPAALVARARELLADRPAA
ncbi:hypothetical protein GCM10010123_08410 [Pilimelia anulata]|uniref:Uncharacterized protein n=1 Tax=Pilimelia anulata TaxID=53371 RepID=A0A8J3B4P3_9ACTN|nr:hypothetical protein GCM10010123_08410 [Pilimelia anulata]